MVFNKSKFVIDSLEIGLSYQQVRSYRTIPPESFNEIKFKFDLETDSVVGDNIFYISYYQNGSGKGYNFGYNNGARGAEKNHHLYVYDDGVSQVKRD